MNTMNYKHPAGQSTVEYAQGLWTNASRCWPVPEEYRLKNAFGRTERVDLTEYVKLLG